MLVAGSCNGNVPNGPTTSEAGTGTILVSGLTPPGYGARYLRTPGPSTSLHECRTYMPNRRKHLLLMFDRVQTNINTKGEKYITRSRGDSLSMHSRIPPQRVRRTSYPVRETPAGLCLWRLRVVRGKLPLLRGRVCIVGSGGPGSLPADKIIIQPLHCEAPLSA